MTSGTSATAAPHRSIDPMMTPTPYAGPAPHSTTRFQRPRTLRFLATYLATYLEMTVSMFVGMGLFGLLWDAVWPALTSRPDTMAVVMAFDMTLGMALWMWVRRHSTRHILQMSATMVLPFLVLLFPYWLGLLSGDTLMTWGHIGMFALMAAYLAWRPHTPGTGSPTPRKARPRRPRPAFAAAVLLTGGAALAVLGGLLHPHDEPPNSHAAVFTEYAHSTNWVWIHDLQFLSAAVVVTGFLLLAQALRRADAPAALVRLGETAAAATVALIAANMAVDGVALKRAVDAWVDAPPSEQAGRFAAAEAIRWVEWGLNSFFTMLLGVTVILFAVALLRTPLHRSYRPRGRRRRDPRRGRPARQRARRRRARLRTDCSPARGHRPLRADGDRHHPAGPTDPIHSLRSARRHGIGTRPPRGDPNLVDPETQIRCPPRPNTSAAHLVVVSRQPNARRLSPSAQYPDELTTANLLVGAGEQFALAGDHALDLDAGRLRKVSAAHRQDAHTGGEQDR